MLFNSLQFLLFFPLVTALYFLLPHKHRWLLLLSASCYFYMVFKPIYILILIFTILIDYYAAQFIAAASGDKRKHWLWLSIAANVGILCFFKYFNFLNANLSFVTSQIGVGNPIPAMDIILPIGLSFHIFQSLSYTIEVYRRNQSVERDLRIYALYVMFYPQLVAGPIERPQNLLHQFKEPHRFDYDRVTDGLKLMAWGLFKKVCIADRLAPFVNTVYEDPTSFPGISLLVATIFFAIQIYCDFSGYSDIAIGAARVMGFNLMTNFRQPYFSASVSEFWRRWHISLSTWFKDYVYVPLGGSRTSDVRKYANLLITFLVSGLWHGANWTYVIWGGINGLYLIAEQAASKYVPLTLPRPVKIVMTFGLILIAWIFFRAESLSDAIYIVTHIADIRIETNLSYIRSYVLMGLDKMEFVLGIAGIAALFVVELFQQQTSVKTWLNSRTPVIRWTAYASIVTLIAYFGAFNTAQEFIYFQF